MRQKDKVIAARRLHQMQQQKIYAATLGVRQSNGTTTDEEYDYCYVNPIDEATGLGGGGASYYAANIELFQEGQTYAPRVDDTLTVNGVTYRINSVRTRLNADSGYAIHDMTGSAIS
jgi:hypothetical protein